MLLTTGIYRSVTCQGSSTFCLSFQLPADYFLACLVLFTIIYRRQPCNQLCDYLQLYVFMLLLL